MYDVNAAAAFHSQQPDVTVTINKTKLSYGASHVSLPMGSSDQDIPEIKTISSFSSLPSTLCIHTDQEIVCLFEICFQVNQFENYRPPIPVALSRLFLHLFRIVVSPNAP
jgi:hypothetical protein